MKRRAEYIKKLESVKERLDSKANEERDKFLKYIEKKEKWYLKVKENSEFDQYEK